MLRAVSLIGYIVMVGALVALISMRLLFSSNLLAISVQVGAAVLMVWARVAFGRRSFHAAGNPTEGGLVTSGPYRHIRHPIYTAACLFGWAGVLAHLSVTSLICGLSLLAGAVARMLCEEKLVAASYPEYAAYAARTWRMIPWVF